MKFCELVKSIYFFALCDMKIGMKSFVKIYQDFVLRMLGNGRILNFEKMGLHDVLLATFAITRTIFFLNFENCGTMVERSPENNTPGHSNACHN